MLQSVGMMTLERQCLLHSALLHSCYIVARLEEVEKGEVFVKQDGKSFHESSSRLEKGSGDRNRTCDTGRGVDYRHVLSTPYM